MGEPIGGGAGDFADESTLTNPTHLILIPHGNHASRTDQPEAFGEPLAAVHRKQVVNATTECVLVLPMVGLRRPRRIWPIDFALHSNQFRPLVLPMLLQPVRICEPGRVVVGLGANGGNKA